MTEAMFDLLYITDSTITIILKLVGIILVCKLITYRKRCLQDINYITKGDKKWKK